MMTAHNSDTAICSTHRLVSRMSPHRISLSLLSPSPHHLSTVSLVPALHCLPLHTRSLHCLSRAPLGMSEFTKLGQIGLKWEKSGIFKISSNLLFSVHLGSSIVKKSQICPIFWANLTQFWPHSGTPGLVSPTLPYRRRQCYHR